MILMVLDVNDLSVSLTHDPEQQLLRGVSLSIAHGETLAVVGASGSGKTTLANAVLGLLPSTLTVSSGGIELDGQNLSAATETQWRQLRGSALGLVPQDPLSNLDPLYRTGRQVEEVITLHQRISSHEARERSLAALENAGLNEPAELAERYPHQLSGGQRQRVLIAIGTANAPKLLIADEPTSALDVTVQRRILDRLHTIQNETGTAILLITHDLRLAAERAHRVVVLHDGVVVETGESSTVLNHPTQAYTKALVAAVTDVPVTQVPVAEVTAASAVESAAPALLDVRDLTYTYPRASAPALREVSLSIAPGKTLALVGESGSGKTTVTRAVLQLLHGPMSGEVLIDGTNIQNTSRTDRARYRRDVRAVFQDPGASLNPTRSVAASLLEPLRSLGIETSGRPDEVVAEALAAVGLSPEHTDRIPRELSGGQKQRVAIARALITNPKLVICDEPISALDVLVQRQVLDLLAQLQADLGVSYLFITHDLAVARRIAHETAVMRQGRVVDSGSTERVFTEPRSDYTRELLSAIPAFSAA
ncbi:ABC transporter ATP-binding protein [Pseudoclavibacter sp. CFCC 13796]|nr:ABC transporter ATP-binding protein [Pseudoclavibacter sp. CFCC 13796]